MSEFGGHESRDESWQRNTAEQTPLQIDLFGVKVPLSPRKPEEPHALNWKDILIGIHRDLKRIVAAIPRLVAGTLEGAERVVAGITAIPGAIAERITRAQEKADEKEGKLQAKIESQEAQPLPPLEAKRLLQDKLIELREKGCQINVKELKRGVLLISIVPPQYEKLIAKLSKKELLKLPGMSKSTLEEVLEKKVDSHLWGTILKGIIVSHIGNDVIVEVGLKSEGVVDAGEFDSPDQIAPGKEVEVLLEDTDSEGGLILLSKRKADTIRGWETIINTKKEGDVVKGRVIRRIKGGLLVDIGVPVFLPSSQVDIRKPGDISRFIGKEIECKILKIDVEGRNIVVSRHKLIEEER
jgi:hypothetical protein